MLIGRYWVAIPVLALAGSLAAKPRRGSPVSNAFRPTRRCSWTRRGRRHAVGVLTFSPALALGPIVEQLQLAWLESG